LKLVLDTADERGDQTVLVLGVLSCLYKEPFILLSCAFSVDEVSFHWADKGVGVGAKISPHTNALPFVFEHPTPSIAHNTCLLIAIVTPETCETREFHDSDLCKVNTRKRVAESFILSTITTPYRASILQIPHSQHMNHYSKS